MNWPIFPTMSGSLSGTLFELDRGAMQPRITTLNFGRAAAMLSALTLSLSLASGQQTGTHSWLGYAHDPQHSGVSAVAAQPLSKIHWSTPVDLHLPSGEILIHYGSPLVTGDRPG